LAKAEAKPKPNPKLQANVFKQHGEKDCVSRSGVDFHAGSITRSEKGRAIIERKFRALRHEDLAVFPDNPIVDASTGLLSIPGFSKIPWEALCSEVAWYFQGAVLSRQRADNPYGKVVHTALSEISDQIKATPPDEPSQAKLIALIRRLVMKKWGTTKPEEFASKKRTATSGLALLAASKTAKKESAP
jgi:hypothetical protein